MANYVGETLAIQAQVVDPFTEQPIEGLVGTVEFYPPGLNPKENPADRTPIATTAPMTWDAAASAYVAFVTTAGADWTAGKWTYRASLTGAFTTWEYGTFTLKA